NRELGGVLASYRRDGFKIDFGSHLISRGERGPLAAALRRAGLSEPRFLTHAIPVRSRGMFEITAPPTRGGLPAVALEAARALAPAAPGRSGGRLGTTAPPRGGGRPAVAREAARALELSQLERARLARMVFQMFTLTEWELRRWDRRTLDEFVCSHTQHPGA